MTIQPIQPEAVRRMSHAEAVLLCRYAKAACPQQAFDEYTPDAWGDLLSDLAFEDCKEAVKRIVKRQPFVAPAEIRGEVLTVRLERFRAFDQHYRIEPPPELADDPTAEIAWRREVEGGIHDGRITHPDQVEWKGQVYARAELEGPAKNEAEVVSRLGQFGREVPKR